MRKRLPPSLAFGLTATFFLSACATKEIPPQVAATSEPPPPRSAPSPRAAPAVSAAPPRPAIETSIIPGTLRDFEVNVGDRVFFSFDKSNLDDSARSALRKQAAWLAKYPAVTVAVQGNADERGTREYNLALGARRAVAVKDYLVSLGLAAGRLTTISFGKERPVCVESTEACWSQNRRAVSAITNAASSPNNVAMRN
jgi:peptidoglycan-associated lipoprotein